MAAGNVVVAFNAFDPSPGTWAAVYESGVGWTDESVATLEEDLSGFAVGVSIDRMGQAIAVWNGDLRSRRYVAGEGWQEPLRALGTNINQYYIWTASAADGSVVVVSNEIVGDENHAPWAIRFE
jgi:hypothetical protein